MHFPIWIFKPENKQTKNQNSNTRKNQNSNKLQPLSEISDGLRMKFDTNLKPRTNFEQRRKKKTKKRVLLFHVRTTVAREALNLYSYALKGKDTKPYKNQPRAA